MTLESGNYVECDYRDGSYAEAVVERVNADGSVYVALDGGCFNTFEAGDVTFVDVGTASDQDDGEVCVEGYPEHDWNVMDERDGIRTLSCRRCGAESQEDCDA